MLLFANEVIFFILHFHVCHIWFLWFGPNININKWPVNIWLSGLNLDGQLSQSSIATCYDIYSCSRFNQVMVITRHDKKPVLLIEFDENQSFSLQVHIVQQYVKVYSCMFST